MLDIGFGELLVCALVALLVLGPEKLPGTVRTVGRWVGRARHTVNNFTEQIDREIRAEELRKRIEEEMRRSGVDEVSRQVNEALRAPLNLPVQPVPENRIAPPGTAPAPTTAATEQAAPAITETTPQPQAPAGTHEPAAAPAPHNDRTA